MPFCLGNVYYVLHKTGLQGISNLAVVAKVNSDLELRKQGVSLMGIK